jgi:hypothetical protein
VVRRIEERKEERKKEKKEKKRKQSKSIVECNGNRENILYYFYIRE